MSEVVGLLYERGVAVPYSEVRTGLDMISRIGGFTLDYAMQVPQQIEKLDGDDARLMTDELDWNNQAVAPITLVFTDRSIHETQRGILRSFLGLADHESGVALISTDCEAKEAALLVAHETAHVLEHKSPTPLAGDSSHCARQDCIMYPTDTYKQEWEPGYLFGGNPDTPHALSGTRRVRVASDICSSCKTIFAFNGPTALSQRIASFRNARQSSRLLTV